jgi:hypothetical protein
MPTRPRHILELGELALEIDPEVGGRVTRFALGGRNLLTGPEVDPGNYGSTFWTSPQSDWGWPPIPEIDSAPFQASLDGAGPDAALVLRGPPSARLGVSVEKRFRRDAARGAFELDYRIVATGPTPVRAAPWEITRVPPGGLTFFATGTGAYPPSNLAAVREAGGVTWYAWDRAAITEHQKLFADAGEGWIAHVDGDVLFVKTFARVARDRHAPGEAQIEIYASPAHTYVEVEQQGAYETIPPGGVLPWRVTWTARRLPAGVTAAVGDERLAALARELAGGR